MAIKFASSTGGLLVGTSGKDILWGGDGADVIMGLGDADNIYGGYGNDRLDGGSGNDYLRGASGADVLIGGKGSDLLYGGSDRDFFLFRASETSTDIIRDFKVGEDQLVLEDGLRVNGALRFDLDFDGRTDTVLGLSNGAEIVLLGVKNSQNWSLEGPNVMPLSEFDLLA